MAAEARHPEPPVIQVVAALVVEAGRVLVAQRRADDRFPLAWEFPGGKVEIGESHGEALRREIREELAITVEAGELYERARYRTPAGGEAEVFFYRALRLEGEPRPVEVNAWEWAGPERLRELDILDTNRRVVRRLSRELEPGD